MADLATATAALCQSATFLDNLDAQKLAFVDAAYRWLGPPLRRTLTAFVVIYIFMWSIKMIMQDGGHAEQFRKLIKQLALFTFVAAQLVVMPSQSHPFIFDWLIYPLEKTVGSLSVGILSIFVSVDTSNANTIYGTMSCAIESRMGRVLADLFKIVTDNDSGWMSVLTGGYFIVIIAFIVLAIPTTFIIAIFASYLAEMIFKVVAIGAISPILIGLYAMPTTRSIATAGLKVIIGGFWTVILASVALGFTLVTVEMQAAALTKAIAPKQVTAERVVEYEKLYQKCLSDEPMGSLSLRCIAINRDLTKFKSGAMDDNFAIFTPEYWGLFVILCASVLLHLSAKTIASTLSGASDGPGLSAAVVAGGQMVAGSGLRAAAAHARRIGGGSGGWAGPSGPGGAPAAGGGTLAQLAAAQSASPAAAAGSGGASGPRRTASSAPAAASGGINAQQIEQLNKILTTIERKL